MSNAKPSFTPETIVVLQKPVRFAKSNDQGKKQKKTIKILCACTEMLNILLGAIQCHKP